MLVGSLGVTNKIANHTSRKTRHNLIFNIYISQKQIYMLYDFSEYIICICNNNNKRAGWPCFIKHKGPGAGFYILQEQRVFGAI